MSSLRPLFYIPGRALYSSKGSLKMSNEKNKNDSLWQFLLLACAIGLWSWFNRQKQLAEVLYYDRLLPPVALEIVLPPEAD